MKDRLKVCHMTSAHPSTDTRVFYKECTSLASAGYDVYLVAPGESREQNGVHVIGLGKNTGGRLRRMTQMTRRVYRTALALSCAVYHIHDPELLPYARKLKRKGKIVIFDSHENIPAQILEKDYLPLRGLIAKIYAWYEKRTVRRLDAVIGVTPGTSWEGLNDTHVMITNYPVLKEGRDGPSAYCAKSDYVCFAGLVRPLWQHELVIDALQQIGGLRYRLYGPAEEEYLKKLSSIDRRGCLEYGGVILYSEVLDILEGALAGIAVCMYCPNMGNNMGTLGNNKIFETMAAGVPVICTDFMLWKEIIDRHHCGICVKPDDVQSIADAIMYIRAHPDEAALMGQNGRRAVAEEFNWGTQEKKLLRLYEALTKEAQKGAEGGCL